MMVKRSHGFALPLALGLLLLWEGAAMAQTYYVRAGDSLYTIATRFGMSPGQLQASNGLQSNYIYPGQALNIPGGSSTSASSSSHYTVAPGDTVYLIAKKYGVSMDALRQANHLTGDQILPGQALTIPAAGSSGSGTSNKYTVKSNDSLYLIAQRYGTTVDALKKANGLPGNSLTVGQVLVIPAGSGSIPTSTSGCITLNTSDTELLARLVSAESSGEPFEGQVAVAASVLNRLRDPRYPKTIHDIIYQVVNGVYYQYSPVLDGRINAPAVSSAYQAVALALNGWDPSLGALGFYNPAKTSNTWVSSLPPTITIGDHVFFKS